MLPSSSIITLTWSSWTLGRFPFGLFRKAKGSGLLDYGCCLYFVACLSFSTCSWVAFLERMVSFSCSELGVAIIINLFNWFYLIIIKQSHSTMGTNATNTHRKSIPLQRPAAKTSNQTAPSHQSSSCGNHSPCGTGVRTCFAPADLWRQKEVKVLGKATFRFLEGFAFFNS